ncbi:hypothetical protein J1605_020717 [Eschrichtius robustus]|uniref:Nuclease-sensitive element-binding protein 1 n=1 Tax=Eschrichtius robustus TaxID=9764 RepID=A0AB34HIL8_ESCRO|nr:hypothetical protein J1605_020717 [Eschrichtius robustus]
MACWESGPHRARSTATAATGLVTITAREEPQLPQGAPVTVAATRSSEAETRCRHHALHDGQRRRWARRPGRPHIGSACRRGQEGQRSEGSGNSKMVQCKKRTAVKKENPRKYLRSVGDGETVEFDVVEGDEDAEAANVTGAGGVPAQGSKYAADHNHYRRSPRRRGPPRNYQQKYQISESREKTEGSESAPEGQARQRRPYCRRRRPPYCVRRAYGRRPQRSNPPVQREVMEGADNRGAGERGRPVRQNMYQGCRPRFRRGPPRQRQPGEDGNEEDKENQGDETQCQQPPQRRYRRKFNYRRRCPENPKPQGGEETKAADPPAENSSACLLPRLSRAGLSKCRFTISTIIRFSHPTRRNEYEIPAVSNERKIGAEDLKCLLFACRPDN